MPFPEISQQDVWWRHVQPDNPLPAMALGARIRQDALQYGLQVEELKIKQQQMQEIAAERKYKQDIQTKIIAGSAELSQTLADPSFSWTDDASIRKAYDVFSRNPYLMGTGVYKGFEDMVYKAAEAKRKSDVQLSRENMFNSRMDVLSKHYENQDEVNRLKLEWKQLQDTDESIYKMERLRQIDEQLQRLEKDQQLKEQEINRKKILMSPEERIHYKKELDAIDWASPSSAQMKDLGVETSDEWRAKMRDKVNNQFLGNRSTSAPQATAPLPMPATKSELKQGQKYNTARGVATWDGEKFVQ